VENLHNDLQTIVLRDFPVINKAFSILKKAGAHGVLMSGSGPTVFGLFDKQKVGRAFDIVKAEIIPLKNWKTFSADTY
jgi:4-diphosphocytidyl-2C-methyl-D-erythritol kinase